MRINVWMTAWLKLQSKIAEWLNDWNSNPRLRNDWMIEVLIQVWGVIEWLKLQSKIEEWLNDWNSNPRLRNDWMIEVLIQVWGVIEWLKLQSKFEEWLNDWNSNPRLRSDWMIETPIQDWGMIEWLKMKQGKKRKSEEKHGKRYNKNSRIKSQKLFSQKYIKFHF